MDRLNLSNPEASLRFVREPVLGSRASVPGPSPSAWPLGGSPMSIRSLIALSVCAFAVACGREAPAPATPDAAAAESKPADAAPADGAAPADAAAGDAKPADGAA